MLLGAFNQVLYRIDIFRAETLVLLKPAILIYTFPLIAIYC